MSIVICHNGLQVKPVECAIGALDAHEQQVLDRIMIKYLTNETNIFIECIKHRKPYVLDNENKSIEKLFYIHDTDIKHSSKIIHTDFYSTLITDFTLEVYKTHIKNKTCVTLYSLNYDCIFNMRNKYMYNLLDNNYVKVRALKGQHQIMRESFIPEKERQTHLVI